MKSERPASGSLWTGRSVRSPRTRFMIALTSGAPEPGSSGRLAIFGSSGSSISTVGSTSATAAVAEEPARFGSTRAFLPANARLRPPNIERLRPDVSSSSSPSSSFWSMAAAAAAAAASAGLRRGAAANVISCASGADMASYGAIDGASGIVTFSAVSPGAAMAAVSGAFVSPAPVSIDARRSTIFSSVSWIASKVLVLRSSERRVSVSSDFRSSASAETAPMSADDAPL